MWKAEAVEENYTVDEKRLMCLILSIYNMQPHASHAVMQLC